MWFKTISNKLKHAYKSVRPSFKYVGAVVAPECLLNLQSACKHSCDSGRKNQTIPKDVPADIITERDQEELAYIKNTSKIFNDFSKKYKNIIVDVNEIVKDDVVLPDSVDWREKGFLTPVRKQNGCGCCYAMATVGMLEAAIFVQTGRLVPLSVQSIVDCADDNDGCRGGHITNSLYHLMKSQKIPTEESYPYVAKKGRCKYGEITKSESFKTLNVSKILTIPPRDENALKKAVAKFGPTVAYIYSSHLFRKHHEGIYNNPEDAKGHIINHVVLVVGYGTEDGTDYWILKDSHGTGLGEDGYIRIARNVNMCSVAKYAAYLLVLQENPPTR